MSESLFDFIADIWLLRDPGGITDGRPRRAARAGDAPAAADRPGDGQGAGGHRVLPVLPAGLAQRGRRARPAGSRSTLERLPPLERRRGPRAWPHALSATATHDTKRGEDVRARLDALSEMPRPVAGGLPALAAPEPAPTASRSTKRWCPTPTRSICSTRRCSAPGRRGPRRAESARRRLRRSHSRVHEQGHQGGQAAHELDQHQRSRTNARWTNSCARSWTTTARQPLPCKSCSAFTRGWRVPGMLTSLSQLVLKIAAPGDPRLLPGDRAVGSDAGRSRQPPPGRLRPSGARG